PAPLTDREIRDVAAFVRSLQRDSAMQGAAGNSRGEEIYRKSGCATCHNIGAEGGLLGPDLSSIGRRRVPDYLRRALLDPEAALLAASVIAAQAQAPYERIRRAESEPGNWLTYSGTYAGRRFSALSQITTGNVAGLKPVWVYQASDLNKFETSPIVMDGIVYI